MKLLSDTSFALKAKRRVKRVPVGMIAVNPRTGAEVRGGQFIPNGRYAGGRRDRRRRAGW